MRAFGFIIVVIILLSGFTIQGATQISHVPIFSGDDAYDFLLGQVSFGPRPPGSANLTLCNLYIQDTLRSFDWNVTLQNFTYKETLCTNIIATWNSSTDATVLLGAHYDTRPQASADPNPQNRTKPVLGANDGGSGTAVLMELAHILPVSVRSKVELVFFDAEDSGGIDGWDWIQGSAYYVSTLNTSRRQSIRAMILVDMVGDSNLVIPREASSTSSLQNAIWALASQMGYNNTFLDTAGASITDDHRPFLDAGIPAVDLIQYPFPDSWHTLADTPDKCSAESLEIVGRVLETFVVEQDAGNIAYPLDTQYLFYTVLVIVPLIFIAIIYLRWKK